jgi:hypothetical protein
MAIESSLVSADLFLFDLAPWLLHLRGRHLTTVL